MTMKGGVMLNIRPTYGIWLKCRDYQGCYHYSEDWFHLLAIECPKLFSWRCGLDAKI
jgi:hypothetical protein